MPEVVGPRRFSLSEVKAALRGMGEDARVRSVLQVVALRLLACDEAAMRDAWRGADSRFQLGGKQAVMDVLADVAGLLNGEEPDDEVKAFFAETGPEAE